MFGWLKQPKPALPARTAPPRDPLAHKTFTKLVEGAVNPRLQTQGFTQQQRLSWAHRYKNPLRPYFALVEMQGGRFVAHYGFAIDIVPKISGDNLTRSATPSRAHPSYWRTHDTPEVGRLQTEQEVRAALAAMLDEVMPLASDLWDTPLDSIIEVMAAQPMPPSPERDFTHAFIHSALGQTDQAHAHFEAWKTGYQPSDALTHAARNALR